MTKYRGYGNTALVKRFVTVEEFADIDNLVPIDEREIGDECWVEDPINSKLLSAHTWTGRCWGHYINFSV